MNRGQLLLHLKRNGVHVVDFIQEIIPFVRLAQSQVRLQVIELRVVRLQVRFATLRDRRCVIDVGLVIEQNHPDVAEHA